MAKTPVRFDPEIDFVTDWSDPRVFADLKNVAKVDNPSKMLDQWRIEPIAPGTGGVEASVGQLDTVDAALIGLLAQHSRSVCRIHVPRGNYTNYKGDHADFRAAPWVGTGFLVSPNILLTNHHVLNSEEVAEAADVEFEYQISRKDLVDGPPDSPPAAVRFKLNPDRLFLTSSMNDFDYTFVWIDPAAAEQFGTITMTRGSFTVRQTEPTYIIHHPGGAPKQASLDDTEVLSINSSAVLYAADTAGGSSGAPVFCNRGRLVALHHAWRSTTSAQKKFPTLTGKLNDGGHTHVVNEGIKLSAIAIDLESRVSAGSPDAAAAATVLAAFSGSDTMTGLFGSLGRHRSAEESAESGSIAPTAYEKVVKVYEGTEMDIDVGAWNIEWLNRDYENEARLDRVATIITDLNLDIWALVEVSPAAVDALIKRLEKKFKQAYKAAYSEPGAKSGKQTTAVLWRPNVVEGERVEWPEKIDELFNMNSRDDLPFEAVHGKIFNRYPGLFRFNLKSDNKAFDFYLVPLHLKAKDEGSLRRRLASRVLSYAVQQMIETHGKDSDWVLLGDVNATLASQDFDALTGCGFTPLSAQDEENGAFTYLKAPYKSLIDNIFVSANMAKVIDQEDFFIVATDRSVSRFVEGTSDHRPIAMRLSLADLPDKPVENDNGMPVSAGNVSKAFDQLLANVGLPPTSKAAPPNSPIGPDQIWKMGSRSKEAFYRDNMQVFDATIDGVNSGLEAEYGADFIPLERTDAVVVFMAEAGMTVSGSIDPNFTHSNGEFGLLPLPNNISFWIGPGAPQFDQPMRLDENIHSYFAYLGALKNKAVKPADGQNLYTDLFRLPAFKDDPGKSAKLLAGVVHGYFWSGNYTDRKVPMKHLLEGYRADTPIGALLQTTSYVHAGKRLLDNRQENIDAALHLAAST